MWGAIAGVAAAFGVIAGGALTAGAGWEWVFFANVPVGGALIAASRILGRDTRASSRPHLDVVGAVLVTAGLCLLVYAIFHTNQAGWGSATTVALLLGAGALLGAFVAWEARVSEPLVPLNVFRLRSLAGANAINLLAGAVLFSTFFFLALYLQRVLGYGPLKAGLAQLPLTGAQLGGALLASRLTTRIGYRPVLTGGLLLAASSLLWLAQTSAHASYLADVLAPSILFGAGLSLTLVPMYIAAQQNVPGHLAGLAAALINTTLNLGGAVGLAVLGAIAASQTRAALAPAAGRSTSSVTGALTAGFQHGWTAGAACALTGATLAIALLRQNATKRPAAAEDERSAEEATPSRLAA